MAQTLNFAFEVPNNYPMMYYCVFKYEGIGWIEDEIPFIDYETALAYAEVEQLLMAGADVFLDVNLPELIEFRIYETSTTLVIQ